MFAFGQKVSFGFTINEIEHQHVWDLKIKTRISNTNKLLRPLVTKAIDYAQAGGDLKLELSHEPLGTMGKKFSAITLLLPEDIYVALETVTQNLGVSKAWFMRRVLFLIRIGVIEA